MRSRERRFSPTRYAIYAPRQAAISLVSTTFKTMWLPTGGRGFESFSAHQGRHENTAAFPGLVGSAYGHQASSVRRSVPPLTKSHSSATRPSSIRNSTMVWTSNTPPSGPTSPNCPVGLPYIRSRVATRSRSAI